MAKKRYEAEKKELSLNINAFDKPTEYSGKEAWANQICALMLMNPGTYPSIPKMGVGIGRYEYAFIEDIKESLIDEIRRQVALYLPDVPLQDIELIDKSDDRNSYIIFVFTFNTNNMDVVAVASRQRENIIDFAVSM